MKKVLVAAVLLGSLWGCTPAQTSGTSELLKSLSEACKSVGSACREQSAIEKGYNPYSGETLSSFERRQEEERRHREILYEMRRQSQAAEDANWQRMMDSVK